MNHQCVIAVSYIQDSREMYILGEAFLRNFYAIFNYNTNEVQLAVNVNAPAGTKIHTVKSGWVIFAYTMAATLALLVFCIGTFCFVTRCCCRKKISERAKLLLKSPTASPQSQRAVLASDGDSHINLSGDMSIRLQLS